MSRERNTELTSGMYKNINEIVEDVSDNDEIKIYLLKFIYKIITQIEELQKYLDKKTILALINKLEELLSFYILGYEMYYKEYYLNSITSTRFGHTLGITAILNKFNEKFEFIVDKNKQESDFLPDNVIKSLLDVFKIYNTVRDPATSLRLTSLESEIYHLVNILMVAYAGELSKLLKKPKNMISAYLKRLYNKNILIQMRTVNRYVAYMPIRMGIIALLLQDQGETNIQYIAKKLKISNHKIEEIIKELANDNIIGVSGNTIILNRITPQTVIFEWGGILVDDSKFDERLCEKLAEKASKYNKYKSKEHAMLHLRRILDELESVGNKRWFDYFFLAKKLGVPPNDVIKLQDEIFKEEGLNILNLADPYVPDILDMLRSNGIKIYIITRGHSEINWHRAKLLGLDRYIYREEIIGSNDIKDEDVSTIIPYINKIINKFKIDLNNTVIVTKDLLYSAYPLAKLDIKPIFILYKTRPIYGVETRFGWRAIKPIYVSYDNYILKYNKKVYVSMNLNNIKILLRNSY